MSKIEITVVNDSANAIDLVDFIAAHTPLAKAAIKRALTFGGGWIKPAGQSSLKRCRKAKYAVRPGDTCAFYYDAELIARPLPQPRVIYENDHWGIWYKPRHQVTQGSRYGDANALERQINQLRQQPVWLIHRLDSAACGLIIFAYSVSACAQLNQLLKNQHIKKTYQARVLGHINPAGIIELPLDGNAALTEYRCVKQDENSSWVSIRLHTGRYHQIRRHFAQLGHPLLGDPRYGTGNAHAGGLQLVASQLEFIDPISQAGVNVTLSDEFCLF
jgi:tRNA pseudouridine32 synthase / 23S rRNA pseudouridine746 synthase